MFSSDQQVELVDLPDPERRPEPAVETPAMRLRSGPNSPLAPLRKTGSDPLIGEYDGNRWNVPVMR